MSLIHAKFQKAYSTLCGRHNSMWYSEAEFIKLYQEKNGKGFCSKCAKYFIDKGKVTAADNTITAEMQVVIDKITAGTQTLKKEYIEKTIAFAKRMFADYKKWNSASIKAWYDRYSIETEMTTRGTGSNVPVLRPASSAYHGKDLYRMRDAQAKASKIVKAGYEVFEKEEVEAAERHYVYSVMKLADRVMEKSFNLSKLEVVTGRVDVNIETTLSDGENTIHAFTIIAEGPIVRPHYRYLVH